MYPGHLHFWKLLASSTSFIFVSSSDFVCSLLSLSMWCLWFSFPFFFDIFVLIFCEFYLIAVNSDRFKQFTGSFLTRYRNFGFYMSYNFYLCRKLLYRFFGHFFRVHASTANYWKHLTLALSQTGVVNSTETCLHLMNCLPAGGVANIEKELSLSKDATK